MNIVDDTTVAAVSNVTLQAPAEPVEYCKGRYFRYTETAYMSTGGRMVFTKVVSPLKRISCPGCKDCYWLDDDLAEGVSGENGPTFMQFDDALQSGDTVKLRLVEVSRDRETDTLEDWFYDVTRVDPEDLPKT